VLLDAFGTIVSFDGEITITGCIGEGVANTQRRASRRP
jgi:hypothetical protein